MNEDPADAASSRDRTDLPHANDAGSQKDNGEPGRSRFRAPLWIAGVVFVALVAGGVTFLLRGLEDFTQASDDEVAEKQALAETGRLEIRLQELNATVASLESERASLEEELAAEEAEGERLDEAEVDLDEQARLAGEDRVAAIHTTGSETAAAAEVDVAVVALHGRMNEFAVAANDVTETIEDAADLANLRDVEGMNVSLAREGAIGLDTLGPRSETCSSRCPR